MDALNEWVTASEAKTYLNQIRLIDERIKDGLEDLAQFEAMATKVTSALDVERVAGSKNPDKMTDIVAKIIELKEDLKELVDKYVNIKREATELLAEVKTPVHYKILHGRYVLDKSWEQIADEIGYTYQWTCHLHGIALLEFAEVMQKHLIEI